MKQKKDLQHLLSPESIAIIGATDRKDEMSSMPVKLLLEYGYSGSIFPVNPELNYIYGLKCYPSLSSLPEIPEVVMFLDSENVPCEGIAEIMAMNVPFLILTTGCNNTPSPENLRKTYPGSSTSILGPDSLGFVNFKDGIPLTCSSISGLPPVKEGNIGLIAQDSSLGFSFYCSAAEKGTTFRYVVTTGVGVEIDCLDIGEFLLRDPDLRFLVFSFHELSDGRRFLDIVKKARNQDVPVAVIHPGSLGTCRVKGISHNGDAKEEDAVWQSVFQQYGVIEIKDIEDLIDLGHIFNMSRKATGNRVGIFSTSRDSGILMCNRCLEEGLEVLSFINASSLANEASIHFPNESTSNPSHHLWEDPVTLPESLQSMKYLVNQTDIDMIIVVLSLVRPLVIQQVLKSLLQIFRHNRKPIVCCWLQGDRHLKHLVSAIEEAGIPVFSSFRRCAQTLAALYLEVKQYPIPPQLPEGLNILEELPSGLTEYHAKVLLSEYGLAITEENLCHNLEEAIEAADTIGYPVALKVMSPNIVQKSQARIIALDLRDSEEVRNAYGRTLQRAIVANPEAEIIGVLVQEMLETGIECMISARRDPVFGPVVSVGLGGIYVEFLDDRSTRIAPVEVDTALEMIRELKGYPILKGLWGQPGYDVDSLAKIVSQVSAIIFVEQGLHEVIINPVFAREKEAVIVDAFMIRGVD